MQKLLNSLDDGRSFGTVLTAFLAGKLSPGFTRPTYQSTYDAVHRK